MASRQVDASGKAGKGKGKANTNSSTPPFKVSANADGAPRSNGRPTTKPAAIDSVPPTFPAALPDAYEGADAKENSEGDGDLTGDVSETHDEYISHDDSRVEYEDEGDIKQIIARARATALHLVQQYWPRPTTTSADLSGDRLSLFTETPPALTPRQQSSPPPTPSSLTEKFTPLRHKYTPGSIVEYFRKHNIPVHDALTPSHYKAFDNFFADSFGGPQEYRYLKEYSLHGHAHDTGTRTWQGLPNTKTSPILSMYKPIVKKSGDVDADPGSRDTDFSGQHVAFSVDFPLQSVGYIRYEKPIESELFDCLWTLGCQSAAKLNRDEARFTPEFVLLAMVG